MCKIPEENKMDFEFDPPPPMPRLRRQLNVSRSVYDHLNLLFRYNGNLDEAAECVESLRPDMPRMHRITLIAIYALCVENNVNYFEELHLGDGLHGAYRIDRENHV